MATSENATEIQTNLQHLQEMISNQSLSSATDKIKEYLDQQDLVELNVAVTGESGSGKSTFVNAFRGLGDEDEGSAKTGEVETTMKPKVYLHPKYENVKLWDLPGIGTPNFKADEYLAKFNFELYDFFIIIASDRFKECNAKLVKEILKMGKKFYFVRSKIDLSIAAAMRKKNFDEKTTLDAIRDDCKKGLGLEEKDNSSVFLISCWELEKYDLNQLQKRMEEELPHHKRHALILALPNVTHDINEKKRKALEGNIAKVAFLSACVATVPLPGLSFAVDLTIIALELKKYYNAFDLDDKSLKRLSEKSGKTVEELKSLMKSPLRHGINKETISSLLSNSALYMALNTVEYAVSLIPIIGSVTAGGISFLTVRGMLKSALNDIAKDAEEMLITLIGTQV